MTKIKKIALIWPLLTSGDSTEFYNVQAFGLSRALAGMGCDVTILTANRKTSATKTIFRSINGFQVIYLPAVNESLQHPVMPALCNELRRLSPDCIQCAEILSPSTYMAFLVAKVYKIPFFIYQGTYKWPTKLAWSMGLINPLFIRPILKGCSAIFTKSEQAKQFLIRNGAVKNQVHAVHLGFERDFFFQNHNASYLKQLCHLKANREVLLCVGRLVPAKNHLNIIKAVEELKRKRPDICLVIVGTGPMFSELQQYIRERNLHDHVKIVTKKIKQSDMNLVYSSAMVFLSPSTYEIFGMTVLEAMACGLPVIGSPVGGMKDIIENGKNGLLVNPEKPSEIAYAIDDLLVDKNLYRTVNRNGLTTSKRFMWNNLARKMIVFYNQQQTMES